ncbi:SRPBCC family protein [Ekhidna sp.]|uniref:SRPBCC family protein n=1 Tax=Ekhidna sp. TaxID=2608089 RepID=UPI003C7C1540
MLSITNSITIDKPLQEVFAFVSDPCNNPKWNYYVQKVEKINESEGIGAEYLQTRKRDKQKFGILVFKANERVVIQSLPHERLYVRRDMRFEGNANQTTIMDQIDFKIPLPQFLSGLVLRAPKNGVKQNLEKLKQLLETGSAVLQDGMKVSYE